MLYYTLKDNYIFINQYDHGILSGRLAEHLKNDCFIDRNRKDDLMFAIYNHDRAWIDMDHTPIWNDGKDKPYSFIDYPNPLKLTFYKKGIDEVECKNKYAALLCSLHYQTLMSSSNDEMIKHFISNEIIRVNRLKNELKINSIDEDLLKHNLNILKFFDNLSLYICLQDEKEETQSNFMWFKDGFPQVFECMNNEKIKAYWIDSETINLTPFPFYDEFDITLKYKIISFGEIKNKGISYAYNEAPFSEKKIRFVR